MSTTCSGSATVRKFIFMQKHMKDMNEDMVLHDNSEQEYVTGEERDEFVKDEKAL